MLLDHIIIAGKLVIYHSRLKNILPSFRHLMINWLDHIESIERSIAIKKTDLKLKESGSLSLIRDTYNVFVTIFFIEYLLYRHLFFCIVRKLM